MSLNNLRPPKGMKHPKKRIGRGQGSGNGKTAGRGHKGRLSRSGGNTPPGYEGGQMPLQRRVPKRGFRKPDRRRYEIVHLEQLAAFPAGSTVGPEELRARRLVSKGALVKCLADGALPHALTVRLHAFSDSARERITAAGGQVEVLGA